MFYYIFVSLSQLYLEYKTNFKRLKSESIKMLKSHFLIIAIMNARLMPKSSVQCMWYQLEFLVISLPLQLNLLPHLTHTSGPLAWVQATCLKPAVPDARGLMALEHCAVPLALNRSWQWVQMVTVTDVTCCGFLPVREPTLGKPALRLWDMTPNHSSVPTMKRRQVSQHSAKYSNSTTTFKGTSIQASVSGLLKMDGKGGGELECLNLFAQLKVC